MIGECIGNVFCIGDEIIICVINVNKDECVIDFEIVGMKGIFCCKFKDCLVVIEQLRIGRKKCGGCSECSNECGGECGIGRKFDCGGKGKGRGFVFVFVFVSQLGKKDGNGKKKKVFFENVLGFKKKKKKCK